LPPGIPPNVGPSGARICEWGSYPT
jgi:hypothetical protein